MNYNALSSHVPVQKFGRTPDIDAADSNEEIWDGTGAYSFLSAATTLTASSSDATDTSAGDGARTIRVVGLDANWAEVELSVTMNGQSGVTIGTDLIRVYRAYVLTAGDTETNAGDIWIGSGTITAGVPANKYAGVLTGNGQTLMAIYTVPQTLANGDACRGARILRWYATVGAGQSAYATVALQTRASGGAWRTRRVAGVGEGGGLDSRMGWGVSLAPKTDIRVRVLANGVNNSTVEAGFEVALFS